MAMEVNRRLCGVALLLVFVMFTSKGEAQLTSGYYTATCPDVESIVKKAITKKFNETFTTAPAVLRLFFHDCFVEGCDASVLIASPDGDAEKDAEDNVSLAGDGFDAVIRAKTAVEEKCPGVVSCADILTIATRDVVVLTGGPSYEVELGRRDGLVSKASKVKGKLPKPDFDLEKLNKMFSKHDLNQTDVIALSGAHTIGFSHCDRFSDRLYSFNESYPVDPSLDPEYAKQLKLACPKDADPSIAINMDPVTPNKFDNVYYKNLVHGKGLFTSDQVLFTDTDSQSTVRAFASRPSVFKGAFVEAITKLGRVDVKTGDDGEIRNECTAFNY